MINDVVLLGLFESTNEDVPELDAKSFGDAIPLNQPATPSLVPRFSTLQDLATRIADAIEDFTGIGTEIIVAYTKASDDSPGSFIFDIAFENRWDAKLSFNSSVSLGEIAELKIEEESFLSISGGFSLLSEFGVVFAPDDDQSLKLVGSLKNLTDDCTANNSPFKFDLAWRVGNGGKNSSSITIDVDDTSLCNATDNTVKNDDNGVDIRVDIVDQALQAIPNLNQYVMDVGLIGLNALVITFDPSVSYVALTQNFTYNENIFGLKNDTLTKQSFQFAVGLTEVNADFQVEGNVEIGAKVGPVEIDASIETDLAGSLELSAGSKGVFLPLNDWLSKVKNITLPENSDFGGAKVTIDGSFAASTEALGFTVGATGGLIEPFVLNLTNQDDVDNKVPKISLDVNLPDIGDIKNLSFGDVIKLLQVCEIG